jgi:hypothetical protein
MTGASPDKSVLQVLAFCPAVNVQGLHGQQGWQEGLEGRVSGNRVSSESCNGGGSGRANAKGVEERSGGDLAAREQAVDVVEC